MGTSATPTTRLLGRRVGHIRVLELIGRGGMGEVYVGFDETLQRRVALKAIGVGHRLSARSKARFLREARILSQLEHPNICRIHDFIESDEADFLVLELIEGCTLTQALADWLDPGRPMEVAIRIAEVLEAAHGQGVVHRDLKPDNVMVTPDGEIKVLDFGLARSAGAAPLVPTGPEPEPRRSTQPAAAVRPGEPVPGVVDSLSDTELFVGEPEADRLETRHGQIVGTPAFMSPEQANGEGVTTASDIYSFGLLLQTIFARRFPHPEGLDREAVLERARRAESLPMVGLDRDLTALIGRMTAAVPAARPTAVTVLERLRWVRDKPRRRLKRLAAAAVLMVIALAAGKYTFDLRAARDESDRRRKQAESLIGFMIGDLRGKLAPANRLEVLDEIGEKALEYFAAVPAANLSNDELLFRSRTLSQIGQVRMDQGDLPAAKRAFEEALGLAGDLAARDEENVKAKLWLGAAHFWVGEAARRQNDLEGALASFGKYLEVSRELVERDPLHLEWQLELAYAYTNLGVVLEARGQSAAAIRAFRQSLEIKQLLVATEPGNAQWRQDLAGGHSWLGEALMAQADLDGALDSYRAGWRLLEQLLTEEPANGRYRWLLGIAHGKLGRILEFSGRIAEARAEFASYEELIRQLAELDPENSTWRRELAMSRIRLGRLALDGGDDADARARLEDAKLILLGLIDLDASNTGWQLDLAASRISLSRALHRLGRLETALAESLTAVEVLAEAALAQPDDWPTRWLLGDAYLSLGEVQQAGGSAQEATRSFRLALAQIEPATRGMGHLLHREVRATALLQLGRLEEAAPMVAELRRQGFRKADFVALCRDRGIWP